MSPVLVPFQPGPGPLGPYDRRANEHHHRESGDRAAGLSLCPAY